MIPKRLKILGKTWKVKTVAKRIKIEDTEALGSSEIEHCKIRLSTHMDEQQQKDTLLHEVVHAIDDTLALGMTEEQVHALGAGLYQVLSENKQLTRWLGE